MALAHFWCRLRLYFGGESLREMTYRRMINFNAILNLSGCLNRNKGCDGSSSDYYTSNSEGPIRRFAAPRIFGSDNARAARSLLTNCVLPVPLAPSKATRSPLSIQSCPVPEQ